MDRLHIISEIRAGKRGRMSQAVKCPIACVRPFMPRFCANISLLFTEVELPERFAAAARAGFRAVEIQFPYSHDCELLAARAREAGIEVVLINMPAGNRELGELGLGCLP